MRYILYGHGRIGKMWRELIGEDNVVAVIERELYHQDPKIVTHLTPELASKAEGAIVCTPTHLHPAHVMECIGLGLPTLCEKPLSTNADEIVHVYDFAKEHGVDLVVGLNRRWDSLVNSLQQGKCTGMVTLCKDYPEPSEEFLLQSGGVFQDCLIHELDIATWAGGQELEKEPIRILVEEEKPFPPSTLLKTATVMFGNCFKVTFHRKSDRYVHEVSVDGRTIASNLPLHAGFMDRFKGAFVALKETMDRVIAKKVTPKDLQRIPTKEQCVMLCNLANRIEEEYAKLCSS